MSKNIIHMRIPIDDRGRFLIDEKTITMCAKGCRGILDDNYDLIVSPFETALIDGDAKVITIDCREYSVNELREIIQVANNHHRIIDDW